MSVRRNIVNNIVFTLIISQYLYFLSCIKEDNQKEDYLFMIDDKEYRITSVLFDYNRMKASASQSETIHSHDINLIRQNFIIQFINEELLLSEAKRLELKIEPQLIESEIREMKDGHTDMTFGTYLSSMMLTESTLREKIERRFLIEKLINSLIKDFNVTEEELREYYNSNKSEFNAPAMCRMRQIVVKTRDEAQNILAQLKKGSLFEELAQTYSEAPEGRIGGDLGFLPENSMDEPFVKWCKSLKEGEISPIIESPEGYKIYKKIKRIPAKELSFDEVKERIKINILDDRREKEKNKLLRRLRAEHRIVINEKMLEKLN